MKRWIISDTHFGHNNILKYEERPFKDVDEMDEFIIKNWNSTVGKYDKVYHLGDFAFGDKEYFKKIVNRLHGNIILIKGNHDKRSNKFYLDSGIFEVSSNPIVLTIDDNEFILSHHPLHHNKYKFIPNLHGHIHSKKIPSDRITTYNFSCEVIDYTPVDLDKFAEDLIFEEWTKEEY